MTNNTFDSVKIQFEKFLSLIGNILTCEKELHIIQNKLRRHFNTTISDYLCSKEFLSSLEHIQNLFLEKNKSTKFYTVLASFDEQLKKHSIKSLIARPISPSVNSVISTNEDDISTSEVQETIEYLLNQCCNILSETLVIDQVTSVAVASNSESRRQRKILRLERRLIRLSRIIRELEEKDMSLDEMAHCDLYEVESNLKQEACQVHMKLSKLKSQSSSTERILHQPITLNESETGHPLINKDLQEMVNQLKNFPSFSDVLETVEKANEKYKLHFNEETRRNLAEKSFKIIGKEIKNRRMADFRDIMYSRLPEDFNIEQTDPALNNAEIELVLLENQRDAVIKTEKIFEEYSRIEPEPESEINVQSAEEEEEMECDIVDVIPPSAAQTFIPMESESNSIEATVEISLKDRTLTILSTASLPVRRTIHCRDKETRLDLPSSVISKKSHSEIPISCPQQNCNDNEIIYQLYRQRLTNNLSNSNKRTLTRPLENSNIKKSKPQSELIKEKLLSNNLTRCVASPTASNCQYFFLVRHGIYLSTGHTDDGLIELGRQQAYAAAETIDHLARSLETSSSSRIRFRHLIQSGYKRAYQTGFIAGHRLERMQRLERSFDSIYDRFKCWGEVHSIERFRERWEKLQRLFFSPASNRERSSKHYVIFSHGNLLSCIISLLMSGASWDRWTFGNIAPHCSVSVLSYKSGDLFPQIVFTPFQILNQTLPKTINNINPRKLRLKEIAINRIITEQTWRILIGSIIPERVVGLYADQISRISEFIPGNEEEARHMLFIFKQYYSQIITNDGKDQNSDSDDEEEN